MNSCTGEAIAVKENGTEGRERERETQMKLKWFFFIRGLLLTAKTKRENHERNDSGLSIHWPSLLPSASSSPLSSVLHPERKISPDDWLPHAQKLRITQVWNVVEKSWSHNQDLSKQLIVIKTLMRFVAIDHFNKMTISNFSDKKYNPQLILICNYLKYFQSSLFGYLILCELLNLQG